MGNLTKYNGGASNPAEFAYRVQTFFNPQMLESLDFNLVLGTYGDDEPMAMHGLTVRWFRQRAALRRAQSITEGVTPTNLAEFPAGYVEATLAQRGDLTEYTDIVEAIDLLNTLKNTSQGMGADAALDFDTIIRNALITGLADSNATYKVGPTATKQAYFERFAGVDPSGDSSDDFASLVTKTPAQSKMTRGRHLVMVTQLKDGRVPKIGGRKGRYAAVVSPTVMKDIREDADWMTAATRMADGSLFKGGDIELDGAVFVEQDNSFIEDETYGTYDDADENGNGLIYSTIYLGVKAFGVPSLKNKKAGGSGRAPRLIITRGNDHADPLDQVTFIGWKALYAAKALITNVAGEIPRYGILRTKATM